MLSVTPSRSVFRHNKLLFTYCVKVFLYQGYLVSFNMSNFHVNFGIDLLLKNMMIQIQIFMCMSKLMCIYFVLITYLLKIMSSFPILHYILMF